MFRSSVDYFSSMDNIIIRYQTMSGYHPTTDILMLTLKEDVIKMCELK